MINIKSFVANEIKKSVVNEFPGCEISADEINKMLECPPNRDLGDFALPCFKLSKTLRCSPVIIAVNLARKIECTLIKSANAVNGYLNLKIADSYYSEEVIDGIISDGDDYGKNSDGLGKTMVIDYSSPNVAKPFHIGHLGSTVIGHSIKKLHKFSGWKAIGINHLGDWGTQFGKMITAYRMWGDPENIRREGIDGLVELYVRFHREAEHNPVLNDTAREEFAKLERGDPENMKLWREFLAISIEEYKKTYEQLGIEFDYYTGESFYSNLMTPQVEILREKGLLKIDDGASIVDLSDYNMPPCLILKKDGSTLYPTRDIAAAVYRKETFDFDKAVYVTSNQQILHFRQLFKVIELMGYDWYNELVHIPYGTVSINGEKLATRSGNVVLLKNLFTEATEKVFEIIKSKNPDLENKEDVATSVGVGAIVFYYLLNSRIKDSDFKLEDALNFDGNTGPYVQYTYARCCSVIEKAGGIPDSLSARGYLPCEAEISLAKTLSLFGEKVREALAAYEPMIITRYLLDVAGEFNKFYHDCRIISEKDERTRSFRIRLTEAARITIGNSLELICMKKTAKI
ncbi:MAG: arginine--tRNA ligase [Clostridia bacterium]|nr:arginine--tRNA ligase [Clostridia bacterium]